MILGRILGPGTDDFGLAYIYKRLLKYTVNLVLLIFISAYFNIQ